MDEIQELLYKNPPDIETAMKKILSRCDSLDGYLHDFATCWDIYCKDFYLDDLLLLSAVFAATDYIKEYNEVCVEIKRKLSI